MTTTTARATRRRATRGTSPWLLAAAAALPLAFLAIFFVLPVTGMLTRGFAAAGGGVDLGGFADVFGRARTGRVLWFTLWTSTVATLVTTAVGLPLAYVLYRLALPGRRALRAIVAIPFVMPTVVVGVMFRSLLAPGGPLGWLGLDGHWAAILAAFVFFNLAVVTRTVGATWEHLDRRAEDAAATLGASPWTVWRTVTWPALAPTTLSAASVVFLFCSTAFGVVLTLGGLRYGTVETEIYLLTTTLLDLRAAAVLSVVQFAAVAAMLAVTAYLRERAEVSQSRSGATSSPQPRKVTRAAAVPLTVAGFAIAFLLGPIVSLVVGSLRRDGEWTVANYAALGTVTRSNALTTTVWDALAMSARIALAAALLAVALGLLVSIVVSRRPASRRGRASLRVLDAVFMLPLGISAVTVGFGFLITLDRPPLDLRSSVALIPIAQAMVALPLVVRTIAPALRAIDDRQRQAAATLGASPWQVLRVVDLAVVRRPLLAAIGFALAVSLGEFGATSFLSRPDRPTLPVVIYQLVGRPGAENFGMALAASVVLSVLTGVVMAAVERLRVDSVGAF